MYLFLLLRSVIVCILVGYLVKYFIFIFCYIVYGYFNLIGFLINFFVLDGKMLLLDWVNFYLIISVLFGIGVLEFFI